MTSTEQYNGIIHNNVTNKHASFPKLPIKTKGDTKHKTIKQKYYFDDIVMKELLANKDKKYKNIDEIAKLLNKFKHELYTHENDFRFTREFFRNLMGYVYEDKKSELKPLFKYVQSNHFGKNKSSKTTTIKNTHGKNKTKKIPILRKTNEVKYYSYLYALYLIYNEDTRLYKNIDNYELKRFEHINIYNLDVKNIIINNSYVSNNNNNFPIFIDKPKNILEILDEFIEKKNNMRELIKKDDDIINNTNISSFVLHGKAINNFIKIPDNMIYIASTAVNRILCSKPEAELEGMLKLFDKIKAIKDKNEFKKLLLEIEKFKNDIDPYLTIYYPGQYVNDNILSGYIYNNYDTSNFDLLNHDDIKIYNNHNDENKFNDEIKRIMNEKYGITDFSVKKNIEISLGYVIKSFNVRKFNVLYLMYCNSFDYQINNYYKQLLNLFYINNYLVNIFNSEYSNNEKYFSYTSIKFDKYRTYKYFSQSNQIFNTLNDPADNFFKYIIDEKKSYKEFKKNVILNKYIHSVTDYKELFHSYLRHVQYYIDNIKYDENPYNFTKFINNYMTNENIIKKFNILYNIIYNSKKKTADKIKDKNTQNENNTTHSKINKKPRPAYKNTLIYQFYKLINLLKINAKHVTYNNIIFIYALNQYIDIHNGAYNSLNTNHTTLKKNTISNTLTKTKKKSNKAIGIIKDILSDTYHNLFNKSYFSLINDENVVINIILGLSELYNHNNFKKVDIIFYIVGLLTYSIRYNHKHINSILDKIFIKHNKLHDDILNRHNNNKNTIMGEYIIQFSTNINIDILKKMLTEHNSNIYLINIILDKNNYDNGFDEAYVNIIKMLLNNSDIFKDDKYYINDDVLSKIINIDNNDYDIKKELTSHMLKLFPDYNKKYNFKPLTNFILNINTSMDYNSYIKPMYMLLSNNNDVSKLKSMSISPYDLYNYMNANDMLDKRILQMLENTKRAQLNENILYNFIEYENLLYGRTFAKRIDNIIELNNEKYNVDLINIVKNKKIVLNYYIDKNISNNTYNDHSISRIELFINEKTKPIFIYKSIKSLLYSHYNITVKIDLIENILKYVKNLKINIDDVLINKNSTYKDNDSKKKINTLLLKYITYTHIDNINIKLVNLLIGDNEEILLIKNESNHTPLYIYIEKLFDHINKNNINSSHIPNIYKTIIKLLIDKDKKVLKYKGTNVKYIYENMMKIYNKESNEKLLKILSVKK